MVQTAPTAGPLNPMRSETFPFPERFAHGVTPLGPLCYFDSGPPA